MEYVKDRMLVVPGEVLSDNPRKAGRNTYFALGRVRSSLLGMVVEKEGKLEVISLKGAYIPSKGDYVIGVVKDVKPNVIEVDLGGHVMGLLRPIRHRSRSEKIVVGDVISARVKYSGLRGVFLELDASTAKLSKGLIAWINPAKVPRIIGGRRSLVSIIKEETGCQLHVGMNGAVVISGPSIQSEMAALSAIKLIDSEPLARGLTDKVIVLVRKLLMRGDGEEHEGGA